MDEEMNEMYQQWQEIRGYVTGCKLGTCTAYYIYKTQDALSNTVKSDVLHQKKQPEYIYINDPHFHLMYEKSVAIDGEKRTRQSSSWVPALAAFWKSLKKSYCYQLVAMAQSKDRADRLKAVKLLSRQKHLKDWECQQVAQMCDARTAVGLARCEGIDLRLFLKPPYSHKTPTKQELTENICNLLFDLNKINNHACIKYRHIVFDTDLAAMELPQTPMKEVDILPLSIETLLHHSSIDNNAKEIITLGALPLLVDLCKYYKDNVPASTMLVNILANISAQSNMLKNFFPAVPAARALANMDIDDNEGVKFQSHLHLLHPPVRRIDSPLADIVFIHGLLGGVFVTWRQRDRDHSGLHLLEESLDVDGPEFGLKHYHSSDKHTLEYLEDVIQLQREEWDALGSDYEMVLSDCPEQCNERGKGPFSYKGCHPCISQSQVDKSNYTFCWPQDWLPQDCHYLRVIGINYDTNLTLWAPIRNLETRSNELMLKLKEAGLGSRPIIWVTHSMGGLLAKRMLTKDMCHNTKAIVFYSVPHRGSPLANLSQATQLFLWPSVEVQELQEKLGIEIVSFAETKPTMLSSLHLQFNFVPKESANPGIGEFFEIPQDHLCICKPDSRQSFLYQKLVRLIQKYIPSNDHQY
ncbi:hypothetical protein C0J52_22989 [Blattella germanica]|nr:hypothetical protein C0J52_22989 [Blattella germanica]